MRLLILFSAFVFVSNACAGPKSTWPKEPKAFLGITLGEAFHAAECPTRTVDDLIGNPLLLDHEAMKLLDAVCFDPTHVFYEREGADTPYYDIKNLPVLGFDYSVSVHMKDGKTRNFSISFKQENFSEMLQAFVDRYGAPTSTITEPWRSKIGAQFTSKNVVWKGVRMTITFAERGNVVDESFALIADNATLDGERQSRDAQRAREALKF